MSVYGIYCSSILAALTALKGREPPTPSTAAQVAAHPGTLTSRSMIPTLTGG